MGKKFTELKGLDWLGRKKDVIHRWNTLHDKKNFITELQHHFYNMYLTRLRFFVLCGVFWCSGEIDSPNRKRGQREFVQKHALSAVVTKETHNSSSSMKILTRDKVYIYKCP